MEVRFLDKTKRIGRLGAVSDIGFELQTTTGDKIETIQVPFENVKSVHRTARETVGRSAGRVVLITAIVVGTVIGILVAIGAALAAAD